MPFTSPPYSPISGTPIQAANPARGGGNVISTAAVIKNISSYLLNVGDGSGATIGLVDPYTTDLVTLSPTSGQALTITPQAIGLVPPQTVSVEIYVTWFQSGEPVPGNFPYALPLSSQVSVGGLSVATGLFSSGANLQMLPAPPLGQAYRLQQVVGYVGAGATFPCSVYLFRQSTGSNIWGHNFSFVRELAPFALHGLLVNEEIDAGDPGWAAGTAIQVDLCYDLVLS